MNIIAMILLFDSKLAGSWQVSDIDPSVEYLYAEENFPRSNFTESQDFCGQHGGQIVKIPNSTVQTYIERKFSGYFWLNAMQTATNSGIYKWQDDNSTVNQTGWKFDQPHQLDSDCVSLAPWSWCDRYVLLPCSIALEQVLCERRLIDNGNGSSSIGRVLVYFSLIGSIVIACIALFIVFVFKKN